MAAAPVKPGPGATQDQIYAYDRALYAYQNGPSTAPVTAPPAGSSSQFIQGATQNAGPQLGTQTLNSTQLATLPTAQALATAIGGTVVTQTVPGSSTPMYQISYNGQLYNAGLLQQMVNRYGSLPAAIAVLNMSQPGGSPLAASPAANLQVPPSVAPTGSQGNHAANPTAPPPGAGGNTSSIPQSAGQLTGPPGSVPVQTTPGTVPVISTLMNAMPAGGIQPNIASSSSDSSLFNVGGFPVSASMAIVAALIIISLIVLHERMA